MIYGSFINPYEEETLRTSNKYKNIYIFTLSGLAIKNKLILIKNFFILLA